jgi:predicted O-linked N-acetylglucosamine transferase (SPINDLY family)
MRKSNTCSVGNFYKEAKKRGIDGSRLVFADKLPMGEHLARHRLADLFLDTFAFNAHTTATEALWAGLPVVTKLGEGFAARVAGSLLSAIGLPELITESETEYEKLALELATTPEKLSSIKQKLDVNRSSYPLFNSELYTKYLEDGYQKAYQRYYEGKKAAAIYVPE